MASGFCVRVLLLSLFGFVQHANALSFRSGGYSGTRHYQLAEDFPWSHKPAFAPPSYENAAQPRGHWGHSYPDRPAASAGRFSGSDGREVVSYSPEGSVSSYGSGSPIEQKPREKPQHQPNSSGNAYESAVVSSYGIQMQAEPQQPGYPPKPQQPGYPPKPQQPGYPPKPQPSIVQSKAGMWDIALPQDDIAPSSSRPMASVYNRGQQQPAYPSKPQQPAYPSKPQQPAYPSKPQQPAYPSKPQQPAYPSKPQQPAYPSKPQQPGVLQSKAGMWDIPLPQDDIAPSSSRPMASVYNRGQQQPGYPAKPQQSSVLQSKAGMWDIPLPQGGVAPRSSRPIPMASLQHPRWQRPLVPVYNRLYHP